jgi:Flp pilus assembly pilin Flp
MKQQWARFQIWLSSEKGASLVEYALLLLLLAVVAIAVISQVGDTTSAAFSRADEGF